MDFINRRIFNTEMAGGILIYHREHREHREEWV
jgi:hypothetical protein